MNFYDLSAKKINGEEVSMSQYKGKVVLVVNTASKCGFTPQFKELEELYANYKDKGLEILGFPCNQFGQQDPGANGEIKEFCQLNYGVNIYNVLKKIDVNGDNTHPIYKFLKDQDFADLEDEEHPLFDRVKDMFSKVVGKNIKWNFTKFLIDSNGNVVKRYAPNC